ncbi:MAG: PD40 domain-containing protein [Bacteroidales bacterium]|nr:PD40 domain-containing protein [Bacteroidales bacterium]
MNTARNTSRATFFYLLYPVAYLLLAGSCSHPKLPPPESIDVLPQQPEIFPDYTGITIPPNIAPLNFIVKEDGENFIAVFEGNKGKKIKLHSKDKIFQIPLKKWKKLLINNRGLQYKIRIYKKEKDFWSEFAPILIRIAKEPIDPYLVYRLIPPGYETWSEMGLYQRSLTTFKESPIIKNQQIKKNCVNCHSFCSGSSENMMFHIRGSVGGTMIKKGDEIEKVNIKTDETISAGVYPSWHPSGKYIAFSTNKIEQYFHTKLEKTIEVLDRESDLIIYNTENHTVSHVPGTKGTRYMETYPCWSPGGDYLYFCRANADAKTGFDSIRYDIFRIEFDTFNENFGKTEIVFRASEKELSASFPKISPDGNYLLCTLHKYGTFPIWHKEADLCLVNLGSGKTEIPEVNSEDTESFHSWSLNSKWIIFSSRRYDGRYTRLYISYMNKNGEFQKAFLLPQRDPEFYDSFFYSYNIPELVNKAIRVNPRKWATIATHPAKQAKMN